MFLHALLVCGLFTPLFQLHRIPEVRAWYWRERIRWSIAWQEYQRQCERDWERMAERLAKDPNRY